MSTIVHVVHRVHTAPRQRADGRVSRRHVLYLGEINEVQDRSMRRRQLKKPWQRLHELQAMTLRREELLMKPGAARRPPAPGGWWRSQWTRRLPIG